MRITTIQKNVLRAALLSVLASAMLSACGSGGSQANQNAQATLQQSAPSGMIGVFYSDTQFKNTLTVATVESSIPSINGAQALSLSGLYYAATTGTYSFTTTAQGSNISIAGQPALINGTSNPIQLTAGQLYQVVLTLTPIGSVPSIDITDPSGKKSNLLPNQFYLPAHDYSRNKITVETATKGKVSLQATTSSNPCSNPSDPQLSCAGDGIPNDWKTNGFIAKIVNNVPQLFKANPTDPTQKGYPIYYANYAAANGKTIPDYYTDYEKVMGLTPDNINRPVDPLVAIFPNIMVNVSNVDLQPVISSSHSVTLSHTNTSQFSKQLSVAIALSQDVTISPDPLKDTAKSSVTITTTGTWNWANSSSDTGSWADTVGANTGNAANVTANLNYVNIGNVRANNFNPTLSLSVSPTGTASYTGTAPQQTTIMPGDVSPAVTWGSNGTIQLDQDHLNQWQDTGVFNIYVNQASYNPSDVKSGNPTVNSSINWADFQPQIDQNTSHIFLQLPGVIQDRAVFVYSTSETSVNPNLRLNLRQAFMRAFNATESNGVFNFTASGQQFSIPETSLNVIGNESAIAVAPTQTALWNLPLQSNYAFHIAPADHMDLNGLRFYYDNSANPLQGFKTTTDSNGIERYFQNGLPVTGLVNISNYSGSIVNLGNGKTNSTITQNTSRVYCMYNGISSVITKDSSTQTWYYCSGLDANGRYLSFSDVPGIVTASSSGSGIYQYFTAGSSYNYYESSSSGILQTGEISENGLWFYSDPASMQIESGNILTNTGAYYNYDGKGGRTILSKDEVTINGITLDQLTPSSLSMVPTNTKAYTISVLNNNPTLLGNLTSVTVGAQDESGNTLLSTQTYNCDSNSSSCTVNIANINPLVTSKSIIITVSDRIGLYQSDARTLTIPANINFSIPTNANVTDISYRSLFGGTNNAIHVAFDLNGKSYSRVLLPGGQYNIDQSAGQIVMTNAADWETNSTINPFISPLALPMTEFVVTASTNNNIMGCGDGTAANALWNQGRNELAAAYNCSNWVNGLHVVLPFPTKLYVPVSANYEGYKYFAVWNSINYKGNFANGWRADQYGSPLSDNEFVVPYDMNSNSYNPNAYINVGGYNVFAMDQNSSYIDSTNPAGDDLWFRTWK